jgi:hypothetical protein
VSESDIKQSRRGSSSIHSQHCMHWGAKSVGVVVFVRVKIPVADNTSGDIFTVIGYSSTIVPCRSTKCKL